MNRREALGTFAGMGMMALAQTEPNGMIYRPFGKTGEKVSAIGLGGHHIGHIVDSKCPTCRHNG